MALFNWLFDQSPEPQPGNAARPNFGHALRIPEGDFRFIALDVETACSDAASICQIGLACVQHDNQIQTFSMLINPAMRFDRFNIQLHGIGPEHVADAHLFPAALTLLLPLLSAHHIVQHSNFDKQAINAACQHCGITPPDLRWSDSVTIARRAWPELKGNGGHGLANLKRVLGLQFHHHDAGEDARAAAMVVLRAETQISTPFERLILPVAKPRYPASHTRTGDPTGPLAGATVVFTGNLSLSRETAANLAARAGMDVKANITKRTTHVVIGEQDLGVLAGHTKSSKQRKAEEMAASGHPIAVMGERDFKALLIDAGARIPPTAG